MENRRHQQEEVPINDQGELWDKFPKVNNYKYLGLNLA